MLKGLKRRDDFLLDFLLGALDRCRGGRVRRVEGGVLAMAWYHGGGAGMRLTWRSCEAVFCTFCAAKEYRPMVRGVLSCHDTVLNGWGNLVVMDDAAKRECPDVQEERDELLCTRLSTTTLSSRPRPTCDANAELMESLASCGPLHVPIAPSPATTARSHYRSSSSSANDDSIFRDMHRATPFPSTASAQTSSYTEAMQRR